jgi:CDP-diglyceride synthetase
MRWRTFTIGHVGMFFSHPGLSDYCVHCWNTCDLSVVTSIFLPDRWLMFYAAAVQLLYMIVGGIAMMMTSETETMMWQHLLIIWARHFDMGYTAMMTLKRWFSSVFLAIFSWVWTSCSLVACYNFVEWHLEKKVCWIPESVIISSLVLFYS